MLWAIYAWNKVDLITRHGSYFDYEVILKFYKLPPPNDIIYSIGRMAASGQSLKDDFGSFRIRWKTAQVSG